MQTYALANLEITMNEPPLTWHVADAQSGSPLSALVVFLALRHK